jgi:hypothetical protein
MVILFYIKFVAKKKVVGTLCVVGDNVGWAWEEHGSSVVIACFIML